MNSTQRLTGRIAIVTGGSQSIGRAIVDQLTNAGATVIVGDLKPADGVESHKVDVSNEESVNNFVARVAADHGGIDIVVNNAGIMFEERIDQQELSSWEKMIAINLTGPMLITKASAPHLAQSQCGAIVNIGSIEGDACNPNHAAYAATKSGVHGLTRATAVDLGPMGIRCNAIAPGWIDTPLNAGYVDNHPDRDLVIDELAKLHPVGRVGATNDVGDVAVWLASDESRFVTGQVITVDGGRTAKPSLPGIIG